MSDVGPQRSPSLLHDRATAMRRVVLGVYAGGLTMGTHWPRLDLGDPEHPPDKMLHYMCFGGLAFFLWQARYFRSHLLFALFGVAWTMADEITQALPGLGRSFSLEDVAASSAGFCCGTLFLWATRPIGSGLARLRRERFDGLLDMLLGRLMPWAALASAVAMGVAAGIPISVVVNGLSEDPTPFQAALLGGVLGGSAAGGCLLIRGLRHEESRMLKEQRCLGCGEPVGLGSPACEACGRSPLPGQWLELPFPGWNDVFKAYLRPVLGGVGAMILLFVVWFGLQLARRNVAVVHVVDAWVRGLSRGMPMVIDATILCIVVAVTIERARTRFARRIDEGDRLCLACGQDLRGTPTSRGSGRCGECGASFVRVT